ncbi:MAG TPA: YqgE/AlgH family protein [Terriglobales bacterium]|nr:YqgE/AlgH family protein [Terriglobales bacterium]
MSLRKLWRSAALATVVAFTTMYGLKVSDALTRNSPPYHSTIVPSAAKGEIPPPVFLPVQSKNPKDLAAGKLLVASRELGDPDFAQTVVLLVHDDAKGAVGLILNRRTDVPLSRVLEQLKVAKDRSDPVYLGGPVETPVAFALLRSTAKVEGAQQICDGVYFISSKTVFEKTISDGPNPGAFHVFLGYAGWDNTQLRKEVELGAWFIFPADTQTVFDSDPDSLWRQMIHKTELKLAGILQAPV